MAAGLIETARRGEDIVLTAAGDWTIQAARTLDGELRKLASAGAKKVLIVLADLTALDTAGAWLIARTERELRARGIAVDIGGAKPAHQAMLSRIMEAGAPPPLPAEPRFHLIDIVADTGEAVIHGGRQARDMLSFLGALVLAGGRLIRHPGRIRFTSLVNHLKLHGLDAMPIVGILLFLVGIVIAYQGVDQLRQFGGEIYVVNLVGISVLREMGVLISSIVLAGRPGSALTAHLGPHQVDE